MFELHLVNPEIFSNGKTRSAVGKNFSSSDCYGKSQDTDTVHQQRSSHRSNERFDGSIPPCGGWLCYCCSSSNRVIRTLASSRLISIVTTIWTQDLGVSSQLKPIRVICIKMLPRKASTAKCWSILGLFWRWVCLSSGHRTSGQAIWLLHQPTRKIQPLEQISRPGIDLETCYHRELAFRFWEAGGRLYDS